MSQPKADNQAAMTSRSVERSPTLLQKLSCASYIYFIPFLLGLNLICLCNKYTAIIWLL